MTEVLAPPSAAVRRSARNGFAGLAGAAVSGLFGFVLAVVITRGYGTAGSGAFFAAIGLVTVAAAVCTLGAETGLLWALPRRRSGPAGDAARLLPVAFGPPLVVAVLAAGLGVLLADPLAGLLLAGADGAGADPAGVDQAGADPAGVDQAGADPAGVVAGGTGTAPAGATLITVTATALPVVVAMVLALAALRCVRPIRWYVGAQFLLLPVGRPVLVGAVVLAGGGVALGMGGWLLPAGVALAVCAGLIVGPLGVGRGAALRPGPADWRTFWGFALPRAASAAIDAGSMWIGVLLTAALAGPADAGIFGAVGRYVLAGQLALQGLRVATASQLSSLFAAGRRDEAVAVHRQLTVWGIVLSWPVYLLLAGFAPGLLSLFGSDFTTGAAALTVLALAMLVNIAVGNVQSLLLMAGRSGTHLAAVVSGLAVHLTLGLLLIPAYGVLGAALAWATGIVMENVGAALAARTLLRQPLAGRAAVRAGAAVVAALVTAALLGTGAAAAVGAATGTAVPARGVGGLAAALAVLAVGGACLLAVPRVRDELRRVAGQIRAGRDGARRMETHASHTADHRPATDRGPGVDSDQEEGTGRHGAS